jgi:thiol peroxidase
MAEERRGEAFEEGIQLTVVGRKLGQGEPAPDFELDCLEPGEGMPRAVKLADSAGTVRLLNVINSLDTPVCHVETHRWDRLRGELPGGARFYTVSMDLPFAQARWKAAEGTAHETLSAHRSERFGEDYGVLLREWRLLQRAVFIVGRDGRIAHAQYVADQMREPDYDAALDALHGALAAQPA